VDSPRSPTEALLGEVAFVHRLARALLRDDGLAHDVAQDALTAALQEHPARHVRGWLAAVTRHLAGRVRRDVRERGAREARAAQPPSSDGEARTAERLRLHRRLCDAVFALPEPHRTAVTLRFFDELPPRAIAKRLGLPAATVRQRLHRGLAMLRQQLDREFGGEGARDGWRGAFAAVGIGKTTVSVLPWLLPVLAMKKVVLGAALAAVVVVGWWSWPRGDAPPVISQVANATTSAASAPLASNESVAKEPKVDPVRTAAESPAARDEAFVVRVVDEREQGIAGADVHRWTMAGALAKQRTGRDGRAEFGAADCAGGLCVLASGHAPFVRELTGLRGETRCTLPDGVILDGTMLVDDAPAPAGLLLGVATGTTAPSSAPREIGELLVAYRPPSFAVTTVGGGFAFHGLEAGRQVTLVMPHTHWLVPDDGRIDDERDSHKRRALLPARGVLLRTTQLPTVWGRVVWADDGSPVPSPGLDVYAKFADGENSPLLGVGGNEDGTFAAGLYPGASDSRLRWMQPSRRSRLVSVRISAQCKGSDGPVSVDLDEKAFAAMPIELRLSRAKITHFVVTDLNDRPIAGARVSADPSTATDEHGHGTFQGKRERVLVGADGFQVQAAVPDRAAAGTEDDPLRFRLAPRNALVLNLRTPGGGVPPIRSVEITSRTAMFCGKRFHGEFDQTFGGSEGNSSSSGQTLPDGSYQAFRWQCTVRPDASGRITLHSLEPGVRCKADAFSELGEVIASTSLTTPPAGETITRDLVVSDTPRTVAGRVQARDGTPLADVSVELRRERGSAGARTKADGQFTFAGVYGSDALELVAKAKGYAETRCRIAAESQNEHVLVLEPGQRVMLRVVDEAGRPVEVDARAERVPGESLHPQALQAGEHLFVDLPPGIVTFAVAFGGATFRVQHDTANPNAMLRVPRLARLVVGPLKNGGSTENLGVRGTRLDAAGEPFYLNLGASDGEAELVVPGRYRVELYRVSWRGEGEARERIEESAAPAQEVEAKVGELVRIVF
jgi:RNA polymerase sigma-70 factor (ECF subfamily)